MWIINVAFGSSTCALLYKTEESAKAAWEKIVIPVPAQIATPMSLEDLRQQTLAKPALSTMTVITPIHLSDDFGRQCFITNIIGASFEDMNVAQEGQIEFGLHQARTQVKANQRGQSDPVLQAANRGPGVISPMMHHGNGRAF